MIDLTAFPDRPPICLGPDMKHDFRLVFTDPLAIARCDCGVLGVMPLRQRARYVFIGHSRLGDELVEAVLAHLATVATLRKVLRAAEPVDASF